MTTVLDPILKSSDAPIPVEAGSALVATGRRGTVAFIDGTGPTFGERMFGGYQQYHLVKVATQPIEDSFEVQSSQITYKFKVTLSCRVTVVDPAAIVTRGIRDLQDYVGADLHKAAGAAARKFSVKDSLKALEAVEEAIENAAKEMSRPSETGGARAKPVITVQISTVMLEPDEAAKQMLAAEDRELLDIAARQSKARVDKAQRDIEGEIADSDHELVLQYLATGEEKYRVLLENRVHQGELSLERMVNLFNTLKQDGAIEPFEMQKMFPDLGSKLMEAMGAAMFPVAEAKPRGKSKALPTAKKTDEESDPRQTDTKPAKEGDSGSSTDKAD